MQMLSKKVILILCAIALQLVGTSGFSQIQFAPYQSFATGSSADLVCVGDLNNDGRNDVALGTTMYFDAANDYKIFVYLQNNSGSLDAPIKYSYPNSYPGLRSLKIADLNNDHRNDIVISYDTRIGILYQNNAATFYPIQSIETNALVLSLDIGDLNYDGLLDLAIGTEYAAYFDVLYQTVSGTLNVVSYPKPSNVKYTEIEIADLNSDGKDDIVFDKSGLIAGLHVYLQTEAGFNSYAEYNVPDIDNISTTINGIAVGDLNHDGKVDIAASRNGNRPNSKMMVWYQNETDTFDNPVIILAYDIPQAVEIDDFNNDTDNELITVNASWLKVSCYQQTETHTLDQYTLNSIPSSSSNSRQGLSLGDLNNDGAKDIAVASYFSGLVVLYNTSTLSIPGFDRNEKNLVAFPNPVDDFVSIRIKSVESGTALKVCDALGQCVLNQYPVENENTIDLSHLQSGLYFLKLIGKSRTSTQKILKK